MKLKKLGCLLLALLMVWTLFACGSKETPEDSQVPESTGPSADADTDDEYETKDDEMNTIVH